MSEPLKDLGRLAADPRDHRALTRIARARSLTIQELLRDIISEYVAKAIHDAKVVLGQDDACFRIQREACEASGRYIPLIVENVRGAQKWVGRARAHYGSYYLWGDVPALLPCAVGVRKGAGSGRTWFYQNGGNARSASSKSAERREWSARVAKIPFALSSHIARVFKPRAEIAA